MTTYDFAPDARGSGTVSVLAIPGSLRAAPRNRRPLRAAAEEAPEGVRVEVFDLRDIPPYDGDVEAAGYPEPVRRLQDAIRRADALLIAAPEYNGSIPGPAVMVAGSAGEFDEEGNVTDEHVRGQVRAVVEALAASVRPVAAPVALEHSVA